MPPGNAPKGAIDEELRPSHSVPEVSERSNIGKGASASAADDGDDESRNANNNNNENSRHHMPLNRHGDEVEEDDDDEGVSSKMIEIEIARISRLAEFLGLRPLGVDKVYARH